MKLSPTVKVGILTLIALIILVFTLMWIKGRAISAGERIELNFTDVDGMRPGSAVQMMGIRVGQVEEVYPVITKDKSFVKVKFVITEPNISIPNASSISIQQSGIIGEKFLEITPPQVQTMYLPITKTIKTLLKEGSPVKLLVNGQYKEVGSIKDSEIVNWETLPQVDRDNIKSKYAYKVNYIITLPGIVVPEGAKGQLVTDDNVNEVKIVPPADVLVQLPVSENKYTIVEPVRLKKFFEIQFKSAMALKETNDKINKILSQDSINDLKATLNNTKKITAEATVTLNEANKLIISSRTELHNVVLLADNLSNKMSVLANNVNQIVGDPKIKAELLSTTLSIQKSADNLSTLILNSNMQDTLKSINTTSQNLSDITKTVKVMTSDEDFQRKMNSTVSNLNTSLERLSNVLGELQGLSPKDKNSLKDALKDSSDITKNLKEFSNKLNKRFLLFRLMF